MEDPEIHHRHTNRLQGWNYSWAGWYFVTICSRNRECLFGNIMDDEMMLSTFGRIVEEEWLKTPIIRPEVELADFVIMPNHLHGIIIIDDAKNEENRSVGTHGRASLQSLQRKPHSLSSFVAGFKSIVTKRINATRGTPGKPGWQTRFYDHIIRNEADLHRIRTYIANNPLRWSIDEENPANAGRTRIA